MKTIISLTLTSLICLTILSACTISPNRYPSTTEGSRKITIFFDGTANDETADTNVKKLHSLITLQNNPAISAIYIEGVGAKSKAIGMATGWGIGYRVRLAYSFLLDEYRPGDEVYIFGFSRGAYSGRILASMLYYAGIPSVKRADTQSISETIYDAFKVKSDQVDRRSRIAKVFAEQNLPSPKPVRVKVMGLWDTVEALGWPDYKEDIDVPNDRYGDQLCNIDKAFHAMSIDDDRARIFTPILLTRKHLLSDCAEIKDKLSTTIAKSEYIDNIVDEVWFAGAHADVGGGYNDSFLSGVSLNWMLHNLEPMGLIPKGSQVRQDVFGLSHDPQHGLPWSIIYKKLSRNLWMYREPEEIIYNKGRLKLHASVIDRLTQCKAESCNHRESEYQWDQLWGVPCFSRTHFGFVFNKSKVGDCKIDIVK
jgi:uncharacterized protein (DUF2235 family)